MCTRFMLRRPAAEIAAALGVTDFPGPLPRFNAAPRQRLPVLRAAASPRGTAREVVLARWALVPAWSPTPVTATALVNARAETAATKPAFRDAFRQRRCAIPADGFFEWKRGAGGPMPWLFEYRDHELLLLAGLWERWQGPGAEAFDSFALLTTSPNAAVAPLHDRMPVLLPAAALDRWLAPTTPPETLAPLLHPCPAELLHARPVNPRLNNVAHDDETCLAPPPPFDPERLHQLDLGLD